MFYLIYLDFTFSFAHDQHFQMIMIMKKIYMINNDEYGIDDDDDDFAEDIYDLKNNDDDDEKR